MADVHLPNPKVAFESMLPIYKKYGIDPESTPWYKYANGSFDACKTIEELQQLVTRENFKQEVLSLCEERVLENSGLQEKTEKA